MKSGVEMKLVLKNHPAPFAGMPAQAEDVPGDERLMPGAPVLLVECEDASLNGVWLLSDGPWTRAL
jgi:hypothetical protein